MVIRHSRRVASWLAAAGAVLAAAVVALVTLLAGTGPYDATGSADPDALIRIGTPLLRLGTVLAAIVCVGALAFLVCCTRPQPSGFVCSVGYGQLRVASRSAGVWALGSLLLVPFRAGHVSGTPLSEVLVPKNMLGLVQALEEPRAWLLTAATSSVIAVGCWISLRWQSAVVLSALGLFALLPPLVTAHGSSDSGHDLATAALLIHVPAAVVWLGVLLALLAYAWRHGALGPELTRRYERLTSICLLVLALSGLVDALVLVSPNELVGSAYGLTLLAKTLLVALLAVGGSLLRRRALRRLRRESGGCWRLLRVIAAEFATLMSVLGLSVGLTHLAVPTSVGRVLGTQGTLLGYQLSGPPTVLRLLTDWRVDVLFGPLAVLLAAGYLLGVLRLRRRYHQGWPLSWTVSWLAGCLVLLLATSSGVGRYAAAMFSVHIASHMLISMLVPVLLALGAPLTLVRAATRAGDSVGLPAPVEWLDTVRESWLMRTLTHPMVAVALFAGSPFALYFTDLFDALVRFHWGHMAINAWFLVVGYLFAWPVVGVDRAPRRLPNLARLGMLLAAMPADILFGAMVIGTDRVIGNGIAASNMYEALALPWVPDLLGDQRLAGLLALVLGELTLLVMMGALLARWSRLDDSMSGLKADNYRTMLADFSSR